MPFGSVSVPMKLDGEDSSDKLGDNVGVGHYIADGHELRAAEGKLRWAAITVENGIVKLRHDVNFIWNGEKLVISSMLMNQFVLGIQSFPPAPFHDMYEYITHDQVLTMYMRRELSMYIHIVPSNDGSYRSTQMHVRLEPFYHFVVENRDTFVS